MRVSTSDVVRAFRALLDGSQSREEIADWAAGVRAADDSGGLEYAPPTAEEAIWRALEFLMGVDLKDGPSSYLHTEEDFQLYWSQNSSDLMNDS
jgi:hypothetical protein